MKRGYKYRIYPTDEQKKYINLCINANVWFWNYMLDRIDQHYKETKKHLSAQYKLARELPLLKKAESTSWINQAISTSFLQTAMNMDNAWSAFFKGNADRPTYHKSQYGGSYTCQISKEYEKKYYNFKQGFILLPTAINYKLSDKNVRTIFHRKFRGTVKSFTISKKSFDYYEVSILVDDDFVSPEASKPTIDGTVGIDLGQKKNSNATLSDGTTYDTANVDKLLKKIKRFQRQLDRKEWFKTGEQVFSKKYNKMVDRKKPSRNYIKLKDKIAKLWAKVERIRSYNCHQITSSIVNNDKYDTICMESLNIKDMAKSVNENEELKNKEKRRINRSRANANMGEISRQLSYKAGWHGKNFVKVGKYYASSQLCNCCGYKNEEVKDLDVRSWVCPVCGTKHDRDINAAINIKNEGYRIITE